VTGRPVRVPSTSREEPEEEGTEVWRDRALRLQAEMENYRKRQQRLAEERIAEEREELLRAFLCVADDLERVNLAGVEIILRMRRRIKELQSEVEELETHLTFS